ncbi:MAG: DNA polymerase Y family protein, partial [Betaproteobacteria bacterium]
MLWVALHLPRLPPGTLEHVAAWACQFTPRVSLEPPHGLLLEVEGSLRLFGGLERLLERLREGLDAMELTAQLAVAPAARAALWRSRGGGARLEELPLEVTGFDSGEFFRNIGISTVGELLKLPREGLARRCGQALLDDLDRALGTVPEAREYFMPPPRFAAKLELPAEVSHADGLLFAARRLLVQLEGLLAARHAGVRGFTLTLLQSEASTVVEVQLASPAREAQRLGELLREKLATLSLSSPVEAIRLEAGDFS